MTDADRLRLAVHEVAAGHPRVRAAVTAGDEVRAIAWEAALALVVAELVLAMLRECRTDSPGALRRRAERLRSAAWWQVLARLEYGRLWRRAGDRIDAHGLAVSDAEVTDLLDGLLGRAAAADDRTIEACRREAVRMGSLDG